MGSIPTGPTSKSKDFLAGAAPARLRTAPPRFPPDDLLILNRHTPRVYALFVAEKNQLFYGDNLEVLREYGVDESIDLIYLDPPFNSNATYNVLFKSHAGDKSRAQIEAFDDTWHWGQEADEEFSELTKGRAPIEVATFMESMRSLLGTSDMLAYLVMMAPRLVEMRRVMKPSASIYLHCDPTASHYLKLLMDAVFGPDNYQNEIIWRRTASHATSRRWPRLHDVILNYSKESELVKFTGLRGEADPDGLSANTDIKMNVAAILLTTSRAQELRMDLAVSLGKAPIPLR